MEMWRRHSCSSRLPTCKICLELDSIVRVCTLGAGWKARATRNFHRMEILNTWARDTRDGVHSAHLGLSGCLAEALLAGMGVVIGVLAARAAMRRGNQLAHER